MRAVVVGAGISGIACANALAEAGIPVEVLDRGRALGGRMASRTLRDTGTPYDGRVVDIGASYFTIREPAFVATVERLIADGVVRPWTDAFHVYEPGGISGVRSGPMRFAARGGLRSVVAALVDPRVVVTSERDVADVSPVGGTLHVDGEPADAVALCMPRPQAVRLHQELPPGGGVWEPVIAVTCVFDERTWGPVDGVFVNDDPVLTWIADDGSRRGDDAPVLVAHVHPVLSARHLSDPGSVAPMAVAAVQRVLGIDAYPSWVDVHRWSYAKPTMGSEEPYWLDPDLALGQAGDAWAGGPRVEAAWLSGRALGSALAERIRAAG